MKWRGVRGEAMAGRSTSSFAELKKRVVYPALWERVRVRGVVFPIHEWLSGDQN